MFYVLYSISLCIYRRTDQYFVECISTRLPGPRCYLSIEPRVEQILATNFLQRVRSLVLFSFEFAELG